MSPNSDVKTTENVETLQDIDFLRNSFMTKQKIAKTYFSKVSSSSSVFKKTTKQITNSHS